MESDMDYVQDETMTTNQQDVRDVSHSGRSFRNVMPMPIRQQIVSLKRRITWSVYIGPRR
jgi:hypothetical protein